jgi:aspartate/methionine/tyrosine aminotransferase
VPHHPDGAFYIYANINRFSNDSRQFCLHMLEEHGIAFTPGADFGRNRASEFVRFSYTTGMDRIAEAVARMKRVLA